MKAMIEKFNWRNITTQGVVRVLISSYFIALSLGVFPGTDVSVLLDSFAPPLVATFVTHAAVLLLALMILLGIQRRAAALVLAIMVFWASYMVLMDMPTVDVLGSFWRDLALIGALIMTYADAVTDDPGTAAAFVRAIAKENEAGVSRPPTVAFGLVSRISRPRSRTVEQKKAEEKYRQDLSAARTG